GQRNNAPSRLAEATKNLNLNEWPGPIVKLYLGEAKPEDVMAAVEAEDGPTKKRKACQANFYSGIWALRQEAKTRAKRDVKEEGKEEAKETSKEEPKEVAKEEPKEPAKDEVKEASNQEATDAPAKQDVQEDAKKVSKESSKLDAVRLLKLAMSDCFKASLE